MIKVEPEPEPEQSKSWKLSNFLNPTQQKSPIEALSSLETIDHAKDADEEEEGELRRSSDDYPNNHSNSSIGDNDKSDEEESRRRHPMLPPSKVKSTPDASTQRTPNTEIFNTALQILDDLNNIQPLSSISDSDDNESKNVSQKSNKQKRLKKLPRQPKAENSSSDETRQRLAEEKRLSTSRGRQSKNSSVPKICLTPKQDPVTTPKTKKQQRKKGRRPDTAMSRPVLSTDSSSDDDDKDSSTVKKPRKKPKSPEKPLESPIATESDEDEVNNVRSPSRSRSPAQVPIRTSYHSDSESNHSSAEPEKIPATNKNKNNVLFKLFHNPKSGSEGGKGGKGGKGKGGQVVVITPDDVQNQSQKDAVQNHHPKFMSPNSAFNQASSAVVIPPTTLSIRVSIPLSQIDVWRAGISEEKLKIAGIRPSKSPTKKRKISSDSWRGKKNNNHSNDMMPVSDSDSSNEQSMENPATRPTTYTTPNYRNDQLNNNVDHHKSKDLNNYYSNSPTNVGDTKLPRIKPEPISKSEFRKQEKVKNVVIKQEEQEVKPRDRSSSINSTHSTYKDRKRKRTDEGNSLMPPTNHERMQNGDLSSNAMMSTVKPEIKKVYYSYFERNEELDPNEFG